MEDYRKKVVSLIKIVCRTVTERPEAIKTGHLHMCFTPNQLPVLFENLNSIFRCNNICPYGDGQSSLKIKDII